MREADQRRHLNQRADDGGERYARLESKDSDGYRDVGADDDLITSPRVLGG